MCPVKYLEVGDIVAIRGVVYEVLSIDETLFWKKGEQNYGLRLKYLREDLANSITDVREGLIK
jgi:hypothetical protein